MHKRLRTHLFRKRWKTCLEVHLTFPCFFLFGSWSFFKFSPTLSPTHFISATPRIYLCNSWETWIFTVWCQMSSAFLPSSKPFNNVNSFGHRHCTWWRLWVALRWWMVSLVFWAWHSSGKGPWWCWIRWWTWRCFCWDVWAVKLYVDIWPKTWVFGVKKSEWWMMYWHAVFLCRWVVGWVGPIRFGTSFFINLHKPYLFVSWSVTHSTHTLPIYISWYKG